MRCLPQIHRRPGNVLMLFALIAFALFAVAGIAIDMGFVWLTRRQMQAAADAAAREGLRFRDEVPPWLADPNALIFQQIQQDIGGDPSDPANRDKVRRWMARNQINLTFADAIDAATGNAIHYGAGPELQLTGGVGDANAFQTVTVPQVAVYKPDVQLNFDNLQNGDLVAGNFIPNVLASEQSDYQRDDFQLQLTSGDSFLVRLRRTKDTQGNDRNPKDNEPGVSTSGKALPLLFAQGSLIASPDPTQQYSPRHHGITVRATAIAQGQPAVAVGKAVPNDPVTNQAGMSGAATFSIKLSDWNNLNKFDSSLVSFYAPLSPTRTMVLIGDTLAPMGSGPLPGKDSNQAYVPLVNDGNQVAGFGYVIYNLDGTLTKQFPRVAAENATAAMAVYRPNPNDPTIPDPSVIMNLLTSLTSKTNPNRNQLLMAPALVR